MTFKKALILLLELQIDQFLLEQSWCFVWGPIWKYLGPRSQSFETTYFCRYRSCFDQKIGVAGIQSVCIQALFWAPQMVVVAKFFWDLLKVLVNVPPKKDLPSDKWM